MIESFWHKKIDRETFLRGSAKAGVVALAASSALIRSPLADVLVSVAHAAAEDESSAKNTLNIFQTGLKEVGINGREYSISINPQNLLSLVEKLARDRHEEGLLEKVGNYLEKSGLEVNIYQGNYLEADGYFIPEFNGNPPSISLSSKRWLEQGLFQYKVSPGSIPFVLDTLPHELEHLIDHIRNPNRAYELLEMSGHARIAELSSILFGGFLGALLGRKRGPALAAISAAGGAGIGTIATEIGIVTMNATGDAHRDNPDIYANLWRRLNNDPELLYLTVNSFDLQRID